MIGAIGLCWAMSACTRGDGVESAVQRWNAAPASVASLADELARLGPEAAPRIAELLEEPAHGDAPAEALALALARTADEPSVACLRRLAQGADDGTRAAALAGLAALPDAASLANLDLVVGALDDGSDVVHEAAFDALASWIDGHPALVPAARLEGALGASRSLSSSARLLGRLATADAHAALRRMLESPDAERESAALDGFAETDDTDAREAMRALLRPTSVHDVRRKACLALGRLEDADAIPDLIEVLRDEDAGLASDARWALERITGEHLAADAELWNEWWTEASAPTLARLRRPHVPDYMERRARRSFEAMLVRGVDAALARARVSESFGVGDATVSAWLAAREAAPALAAPKLALDEEEPPAAEAPHRAARRVAPVRAARISAPEAATVASLLQLLVMLAACVAATGLLVVRARRRRRVRRTHAGRGPIVEAMESTPTLEVVTPWKD